MKRFYYNLMQDVTEHIGWQLFFFDIHGYSHRKFFGYADHYKRKLAMLNHPSNAKS